MARPACANCYARPATVMHRRRGATESDCLCADCAARLHGPLAPTAMDRAIITETRREQTAKLLELIKELQDG